MNNLTTEEMIEVGEVFINSFTHVLNNYVGESRLEIISFVNDFVLREKPYILVSAEGLPRAIGLVFEKDSIRDFIFTLHFTFFSRWGHNADAVAGLNHNVARGVAIANNNRSPLIAIPEQINERLLDVEDACSLIKENSWLLIILLISLFVVVQQPTIKAK